METLLVLVFLVAVLAYYGFMKSAEKVADIMNDTVSTGHKMAKAELTLSEDAHMVSIITRTAELKDQISDNAIKDAEEVKAKLLAMRG